MNNKYQVELQKESLIFSAAHFITFADASGRTICESIHGHNYRVACRISGDLDQHDCVIDFIWLRDQLSNIVAELDHHVLLPDSHEFINVQRRGAEVEVRFEDRRWVFPAQDVALLPMSNTTAERLAGYIAGQLSEKLAGAGKHGFSELQIGVDENEGQWAWCKFAV